MKTQTGILSIGLLIAFAQQSNAQSSDLSKTGLDAATFLSIEVGPRAKAMGGAFVATANDVSAIYWNPAGLVNLERKELFVSHTEWLADVNYDFAGFTTPIGNLGVLGFSLTSLTMPSMTVRTVLQPEGTGQLFDASDLALGISFATRLTDRFAVGANIKYIQSSISNSTAETVAIDLGMLFNSDFHNLNFGVSMSNFGGSMKLSGTDTEIQVDVAPGQFGNNDRIQGTLTTESFQIPLTLRAGLAMDIFESSTTTTRLAIDAVVPNDNKQYVNVGAEFVALKMIAFRAGYRTLFLSESEEGLTLGVGIGTDLGSDARINVDYAYSSFGVFDNVHEFALSIAF